MTGWLTEKEVLPKDPIVPPTQDSLPPPKVVQMERCSTWKSEKLHRWSLTIWRLGNHTHTDTHKHAQNTSLKEPIQREEFCQFLYRLYLKHWSSQIRSIPRHQRHSLFYLHLTRTMHFKDISGTIIQNIWSPTLAFDGNLPQCTRRGVHISKYAMHSTIGTSYLSIVSMCLLCTAKGMR